MDYNCPGNNNNKMNTLRNWVLQVLGELGQSSHRYVMVPFRINVNI